MAEPDEHHDEDSGPIGIFPSWRWVYGSVVIYTLVLIAVLWVFTVVLNHSVR